MGNITSLGIGSGLDLNGLLTQLEKAERVKLQPIENRINKEESRISGYGTLKNALSELQDASNILSDVGSFNKKTVNIDGDSVSATVEEISNEVSYDINVTQLATRGNIASNKFSEKGSELVNNDTNLVIDFNAQPSLNINIKAGSTLEDINNIINEDTKDVSSSILFDGADYRLILSSKETGSEASISGISMKDISLNDVISTEVQNIGQNAYFTANGISVTSQSNQVGNAIEGLSMSLNGIGNTVLKIENDDEIIKEKIVDFVDAYNNFKDITEKLTNFDIDSGESASLNGEYAVRKINSDINSITSSISGNGEISMLADLGISTNKEGRLEINDSKIEGNIAIKREEISDFFSNKDYGFANNMTESLDRILSFDGIVNNSISGSESRVSGLKEQYDRFEKSIDTNIERYREQFQQLDTMISQMSQTSNYLSQQLSLLSSLE